MNCRNTLINSESIRIHRTQLSGHVLRGVKNTIAIASGKGGVGKSTVTVNLATILARLGAKVGILDADIYGPSIPLMLGKPTQPLTSQDLKYLPAKIHGLQTMSIGYLADEDQALIWRGPMLAKAVLQLLNLTVWDNLDYLFIDLPPGTGDIPLSLVQKIPLTTAIIVTTPQEVATIDASKAIKLFNTTRIDILGIVENMASHTCNHCGHQETIFGIGGAEKLCEQFNLPLLGSLPLEQAVQQQADLGRPMEFWDTNDLINPWAKTALNLTHLLAQKPLNYAAKFPPIVVNTIS
ncbi:MAG: ATPase [Legionellales bacterium RIFCSPHIGHO2_12_FULL_42_9]|nr:MAG: ATPase [Legionellales bacterium RIFCSPHIGHO2_12_FULL_42_9]